MKMKTFLLASLLFVSATISAQMTTPQPSPSASITQTVGLTEISVDYSRPGLKGRKFIGEIKQNGDMWRLGANASTKFKTDQDITLGGLEVPAGEYALYAVLNAGEWEMVVHKDLTLWGYGGYDKANDLGRFKVKTQKASAKMESLLIDFQKFTTDGADMIIWWDDVMVSIPVKTNAIADVEAQIKSMFEDGPSAGDYHNAARFYLDQKKNMDKALEYVNIAIEKRPDAFWYVHRKALIQAEMGKTKEAIATATKSMEMAKANPEGDYGYVANNEKLIKELKMKK